ncbi:hypothetical protein CE91St62_33350 [Lachnospiraceae bacterium]|nr:hypothetical protein CE91St61_33480 [Lachnospiraceae bacterium]BDF39274.1 hypothetical protein CE91St62_33350 [Lachnospiraceae bacterium]
MDATDQQRHTSTLAHASKVDSGREAGWEMRSLVRIEADATRFPVHSCFTPLYYYDT